MRPRKTPPYYVEAVDPKLQKQIDDATAEIRIRWVETTGKPPMEFGRNAHGGLCETYDQAVQVAAAAEAAGFAVRIHLRWKAWKDTPRKPKLNVLQGGTDDD